MKIYLDNCCYNRPFDDQTQIKINLESQAKLKIQEEIKEGNYELVWSYVLDYEANKNPFVDRKAAIAPWRNIASVIIREETAEIIETAESLVRQGLKEFDALHIACAKEAGCNYFITTDKRLLRVSFSDMKVVNPMQFILEEMEDAK
jgi:predicted nucleic acid-binding protein